MYLECWNVVSWQYNNTLHYSVVSKYGEVVGNNRARTKNYPCSLKLDVAQKFAEKLNKEPGRTGFTGDRKVISWDDVKSNYPTFDKAVQEYLEGKCT